MKDLMISTAKQILPGIPNAILAIQERLITLGYKAPELLGGDYAKDLQEIRYKTNILELAIAQEKLQKICDGSFNLHDYEVLTKLFLTPNLKNFFEQYDTELRLMANLEVEADKTLSGSLSPGF